MQIESISDIESNEHKTEASRQQTTGNLHQTTITRRWAVGVVGEEERELWRDKKNKCVCRRQNIHW
jgi:hypothetical protein